MRHRVLVGGANHAIWPPFVNVNVPLLFRSYFGSSKALPASVEFPADESSGNKGSTIMLLVPNALFVAPTSQPPATTHWPEKRKVKVLLKYAFPAAGTALMLQFVEPVKLEVPTASFDFRVMLAA